MATPRKRDKKKVSDTGELIKERKGLERTNKPVVIPNNPTWLKQPTVFTMLSGDFNTLHLRILISLVEKVQDSIEQSINNIPTTQLSLFKKDKVQNNKIVLTIPTKDFGVEPQNYKRLRQALLKLASIPVEIDAKDPVTGADSWAVSGLFKAYIPKETHRRHISIEMEKNVARMLVNVEKGFTKYIKEVAFQTQNKYSVRIYMLISSWRDRGGFSITLEKFRKWLKLEDKYPEYKDLYKRVIRPVYVDLFEKANNWFEVAEVYRPGETEPYKLNFKVIRSALTIQEEEYLKSRIKQIEGLAFRHLRMQDKHMQEIIPLITIQNAKQATEKVLSLHQYISNNKVTSIPDYCTKALINELTPPEGVIGEEIEE